jgi:hypothetical protein
MTPPKPNQVIPHPLLTDLLDPALCLPDIARRHDLPLPEVAQILESQAFTEAAAVVVEAAAVRARLLQPLLRQRALHATCRVMGQDATSAARAESVRKAVNMILRWPDLPAQPTAGCAPETAGASALSGSDDPTTQTGPLAGPVAAAPEPAPTATPGATFHTAPDIPPEDILGMENPGADITNPFASLLEEEGRVPPWALNFAKARVSEWLGLKAPEGTSGDPAHALAAALAEAGRVPDPMDATTRPTPDSLAASRQAAS